MSSEDPNNSLQEVYKLAHDVAEEFDQLASVYGIDNIKSLIEKVIQSFEMLEANTKKIEQMEMELADILTENLRLSTLKNVHHQEKMQLKESFEEAEELWLKEIVDLKTEIASLTAENEALRNDLSTKKDVKKFEEDTSKSIIEQQEISIHKLRHVLTQKEKQIQDSICNSNALSDKLKDALEKNKALHVKNQKTRMDITKLIMEKHELKGELYTLKKENALLSENIEDLIHCTSQENKVYFNDRSEDLQSDAVYLHEYTNTRKCISQHIKLEMKLLNKIKDLQSDLQVQKLKSKQYEDDLLSIKSEGKNQPFLESKVSQLFHFFLGVPTIFEIGGV